MKISQVVATLLLSASFMMVGCGSSSDSGSSNGGGDSNDNGEKVTKPNEGDNNTSNGGKITLSPINASGRAVDGYLRNADVCLDLDGNRLCNVGEPSSKTVHDGSYVLNITVEHQKHVNFSTAYLIAYGGQDSDLGKDFNGKLVVPFDVNSSTALYISPLTTLVAAMTEGSSALSQQDAELKLAAVLNLTVAELYVDPVAKAKSGDTKVLSRSLELQKAIEVLASAQADGQTQSVITALAEGLKSVNVSTLTSTGTVALLAHTKLSLLDVKTQNVMQAAEVMVANVQKAVTDIESGDAVRAIAAVANTVENVKLKLSDEVKQHHATTPLVPLVSTTEVDKADTKVTIAEVDAVVIVNTIENYIGGEVNLSADQVQALIDRGVNVSSTLEDINSVIENSNDATLAGIKDDIALAVENKKDQNQYANAVDTSYDMKAVVESMGLSGFYEERLDLDLKSISENVYIRSYFEERMGMTQNKVQYEAYNVSDLKLVTIMKDVNVTSATNLTLPDRFVFSSDARVIDVAEELYDVTPYKESYPLNSNGYSSTNDSNFSTLIEAMNDFNSTIHPIYVTPVVGFFSPSFYFNNGQVLFNKDYGSNDNIVGSYRIFTNDGQDVLEVTIPTVIADFANSYENTSEPFPPMLFTVVGGVVYQVYNLNLTDTYVLRNTKHYKLYNDIAMADILNAYQALLDNTVPIALPPISPVVTTETLPVLLQLDVSDPDGNTITYIVNNPSHGTLSGTAPNLTYTPESGFVGNDSFTFSVYDGFTHSALTTVELVVNLSDRPVGFEQNLTMSQGSTLNIELNGSTMSGNALSYILQTQPSRGTLNGTGPTLTYTPPHGFYGVDKFSFVANDSLHDSNVTWVYINVKANEAPIGIVKSVNMESGIETSILLSATDLEGDSLTYSIVQQPLHGTLNGTAPNLIYTVSSGYIGADNFTFVANDGFQDSVEQNVTIEITANQKPMIYDIILNEGGVSPSFGGTGIGDKALFFNGGDNSSVTYRLVTAPTKGSLSDYQFGEEQGFFHLWVAYTFDVDCNAVDCTDVVEFVVNDGELDSDIIRFNIVDPTP